MSNPAATTGYTPTIHMPIIAPPQAIGDPQTHYTAVVATTTLTAVPRVGTAMIDVTTSNAATATLFAMTGGNLTFVRTGDPLPTLGAPISPVGGTLVLECLFADVEMLKKTLPPGVPAVTRVLYMNVDQLSLEAALMPIVRSIGLPALQTAWQQSHPPASVSRATMQDDYWARFLLGQTTLFVHGGTPIADAGLSDPANPGSARQVTLLFLDGAGKDLSGVLHLSRMPAYGGARWSGHPLATILDKVPVPIDFYVGFEVWDETAGAFVALPNNVQVDLMDYDPISQNDVLQTQYTDAFGRVHFSYATSASLETQAGEVPDIFFLVRTGGINHAGHKLPDEWSTKGWNASDGSPGYFDDFSGTRVGDPTTPVVFRIGLDFHLRLELQRGPKTPPPISYNGAPIGIPLSIVDSNGVPIGPPMRTKANGEVHGVLFDVTAGTDIGFHVDFEIEDANINLPRAVVPMDQSGWSSFWDDADKNKQTYYPQIDQTSIGTRSSPARLRCTVNDRNVALFLLKILREVQTFFFQITGSNWKGVDNLEIYRDVLWPAQLPYSWPIGTVRISPAYHWERSTLVHELTHQVVWKQADYSSVGIAFEALFGSLALFHDLDLLLDNEQAFLEGWPEFIEAIFVRSGGYTNPSLNPPERNWRPGNPGDTVQMKGNPRVNPATLSGNWGEQVEGQFANGMWQVFRDHVVTSAYPDADVLPSVDGNVVLTTGAWLSDPAVQERFLRMIWEPLKDLSASANPTTTEYLEKVRLRNPVDWPLMKVTLNAFNMAI
jgi:hypothetical protein